MQRPTPDEIRLFERSNDLLAALHRVMFPDVDNDPAVGTADRQGLLAVRLSAATSMLAAVMLVHDVGLEYVLRVLLPTLERMRRDVDAKLAAADDKERS